jgi:hypothetical protein
MKARPEHVVLISIDGLLPAYYLEDRWPAPAIQQLYREGAHAVAVRSVFPALTYPGHTTLVTGALPALWRGLLYDAQARAEAKELLPQLSFQQHLEFHETAQKQGLRGELGGIPRWRFAREMVEIARRGLRKLPGNDAPLLDPLLELANGGASPAERVLRVFEETGSAEAVLAAATI